MGPVEQLIETGDVKEEACQKTCKGERQLEQKRLQKCTSSQRKAIEHTGNLRMKVQEPERQGRIWELHAEEQQRTVGRRLERDPHV